MDPQKSILLTGATGFVGKQLFNFLKETYSIKVALHRSPKESSFFSKQKIIRSITSKTDWKWLLEDVNTVIHLAARVHVMDDKADDPLAEFRKVNVHGTVNLARQAADSKVKRFIYLSSVKVCGEQTAYGSAFSENDVPNPIDPYAISKLEAEQELRKIASETGMEVVIIRPPLVYGPGVKANFLRMMEWLCKGVPLPLGAVQNKRSLVGLDNLIDFISACIEHPAAADEIFFVSDGEDISTTELLKRTARALGVPARLLPVPPRLLKVAAKLTGKTELSQRLLGNLQVDISRAKKVLGWRPPFSLDQELEKTARWFLENRPC